MAMEKNQKNNAGQAESKLLVATMDQSDVGSEEVTAPMDALEESATPFYSRNRRYSRYRSSRGGRNSLT
jgi:hypothetical protein